MEKQRFTKSGKNSPGALAPGEKRYDVYDDEAGPGGVRGLVVTVHPTGVRTWYVIRKIRGQVERVKVGRVEDFDPEKARKRAAKINATVAEGRSPAAERRAIRAEMTLGALWAAFKLR
ncbi:MAG: Arm DNA-binding domain-containing protein, partial [Thermoanaerobaculaceae bacterium]|nr:Arm DNA-binding domain-containing protein [Thermoanaerobaculaceae bacterium]